VRGVTASLPVAARCPSQHPSCLPRHRGRAPRTQTERLPIRVTVTRGPLYLFLTFDAPGTELTCLSQADCCQADQSREDPPPLGLSGAPPPVFPCASTPPELAPRFGPRHGDRGSRSVPVVSHHSDGFLRSMGSGPVASRYRTWGSLGFNGAVVCSTPCGVPGLNQGRASDGIRVPTSATPFEGLLLVGSRCPSLGSAPS
jgi:hypothetical protein